MKVYTVSDISHLYGFTQRQIDGWDKSGLIKPSIRSAHGKGSQRLYSFDDLLCFGLIKRLHDAGWHTHTIRTALRNLRNILPDKDPLRNLVLLDANGSILARCSTDNGQTVFVDALSRGQLVMAFTINSLHEQVLQNIMKLEESTK